MKVTGVELRKSDTQEEEKEMGWAPYNWNLVRESMEKKAKEKAQKQGKDIKKTDKEKEEKAEGCT